jgi:hypothetical protein
MLITNPKEFEHVAREWAVKYAGAPEGPPGSETTGAEGSGGVTEDTLRKKDEQKRERAEAAKVAQYVSLLYFMSLFDFCLRTYTSADTTGTTSRWSTALPPWALTFRPSLPLLNSPALTRMKARTMNSRRSTWGT